MIRQDYLIRLIEQAAAVLARIASLSRENRQEQAIQEVDRLAGELVASDLAGLISMDEAAIQARLREGESGFFIREKALILAAALRHAGEVFEAREESDQACECHLKALHLLLGVGWGEDGTQLAAFVPTVEQLHRALAEYELPISTQLGLMRHYEASGAFDKAEDVLHRILEVEPSNPALENWAASFYQRLRAKTDEQLIAGGLTIEEVETGLASLNPEGRG